MQHQQEPINFIQLFNEVLQTEAGYTFEQYEADFRLAICSRVTTQRFSGDVDYDEIERLLSLYRFLWLMQPHFFKA